MTLAYFSTISGVVKCDDAMGDDTVNSSGVRRDAIPEVKEDSRRKL